MSFGKCGSAIDHKRYMEPVISTSRRRCSCGCKNRATHLGMANGVALTSGCELYVRRWVRDGIKARSVGPKQANQSTNRKAEWEK
jgi:hypothetical protein